jgi:hypothetical protein
MYELICLKINIEVAVDFSKDTMDLRLQGGSHPMEGRVEVKVQGQWSTICDDNWDNQDATTVCRMLTDYPIDQ